VVRYLPDQKIRLTDPLSLLRRSRQKSAAAAETMHSESSRFHAHRFTFGGVIAERVYTVETHHKVFPVFVCSLASSRIKMCSIIVHAHVRIYIYQFYQRNVLHRPRPCPAYAWYKLSSPCGASHTTAAGASETSLRRRQVLGRQVDQRTSESVWPEFGAPLSTDKR